MKYLPLQIAICLLALVGIASEVFAERLSTETRCPITFEVGLKGTSGMVGEPIVMTYRMTNLSKGPVTLDLGNDKDAWLDTRIIDGAGNQIPRLADRSPRRFSQFRLGPVSALAGGAKYEDRVVITRQFQLSRPGAYRVLVAVDAPCYSSGGEKLEPLRAQAEISITASRPSPLVLRRTARKLAERILALGGTSESAWHEMQELMSMPEEYCLAVVPEIVSKSRGVRGQLKQELQRIGSPKSLALFTQIGWLERNEQKEALNPPRTLPPR